VSDILIGRNDTTAVELDPHFCNRHGTIAGATGTGKTVSLMVLAEGFSRLGTPVFLADVKGDIAGMSQPAASPPGDKLRRQGMIETMAKQTVRIMGSQLGRQILRGVLGGIFGGRR